MLGPSPSNAQGPSKVLIVGGKPAGGIASYAHALACGFKELGYETEVIAPGEIYRRLGSLRDPGILKILSTTAVFGAPIARRAICVAHGFPCAAHQGWMRTLGVLASYRVSNASRGTQLVVVSDYSALHLESIFALHVDAVIRNPLHPLFLKLPESETERTAITFVGRLHHSKNIHKLLPAISEVLDAHEELQAWIIGDGAQRAELEAMSRGSRIEFLGVLSPLEVRERLRRTRVFVSANPTEPFGIVYLEALSQGCVVVMPASGGGLEIAPQQTGESIHLFPASVEQSAVSAAIEGALRQGLRYPSLEPYTPRAVAQAYLRVERQFNSHGVVAEAGR